MPKKSIAGYNRKALRSRDERFYSTEDIDAIIDAAGGLKESRIEIEVYSSDADQVVKKTVSRRVALERELQTAADGYLQFLENLKRPTNKQLADAFADIERSADGLLKALSLPIKNPRIECMPPALLYGGLLPYAREQVKRLGGGSARPPEIVISDTIRGIAMLRNWSSAAKERARARSPTPRNRRHQGDPALDFLIERLGRILVEVFGRRIATSVGKPGSPIEGRPTGPMLRYLKAALSPLLGDQLPSDNALRERVRKVFDLNFQTRRTLKKFLT